MGAQSITPVAFAIVVVGSVLFALTLPVLGIAALRGSGRAMLRIVASMAALAAIVLFAALVVGSAPSEHMVS